MSEERQVMGPLLQNSRSDLHNLAGRLRVCLECRYNLLEERQSRLDREDRSRNQDGLHLIWETGDRLILEDEDRLIWEDAPLQLLAPA